MLDEVKFDSIIAEIAKGEPTYKAAPAQGIPFGTFWGWVASDDAHSDKYARAKMAGLERLAEEILQIADESRIGEKRKTVQITSGSGDEQVTLPAEEVVTGDMVERAKLQVDARKWLLSKLAPKKYGDRTILAGDAENPLRFDNRKQIAS
jgi:hypothetical protein